MVWILLKLLLVTLRLVGDPCRDLVLENLALRHRLGVCLRARPPQLQDRDRRFWSSLAKSWTGWRDALVLVQPETVVRWHRTAWRRYWTWKSRRQAPGRPRLSQQVQELIRRMARENPCRGAVRIVGELKALGIDVSASSVRNYLRQALRRPPSPTWRTFLRLHSREIWVWGPKTPSEPRNGSRTQYSCPTAPPEGASITEFHRSHEGSLPKRFNNVVGEGCRFGHWRRDTQRSGRAAVTIENYHGHSGEPPLDRFGPKIRGDDPFAFSISVPALPGQADVFPYLFLTRFRLTGELGKPLRGDPGDLIIIEFRKKGLSGRRTGRGNLRIGERCPHPFTQHLHDIGVRHLVALVEGHVARVTSLTCQRHSVGEHHVACVTFVQRRQPQPGRPHRRLKPRGIGNRPDDPSRFDEVFYDAVGRCPPQPKGLADLFDSQARMKSDVLESRIQ